MPTIITRGRIAAQLEAVYGTDGLAHFAELTYVLGCRESFFRLPATDTLSDAAPLEELLLAVATSTPAFAWLLRHLAPSPPYDSDEELTEFSTLLFLGVAHMWDEIREPSRGWAARLPDSVQVPLLLSPGTAGWPRQAAMWYAIYRHLAGHPPAEAYARTFDVVLSALCSITWSPTTTGADRLRASGVAFGRRLCTVFSRDYLPPPPLRNDPNFDTSIFGVRVCLGSGNYGSDLDVLRAFEAQQGTPNLLGAAAFVVPLGRTDVGEPAFMQWTGAGWLATVGRAAYGAYAIPSAVWQYLCNGYHYSLVGMRPQELADPRGTMATTYTQINDRAIRARRRVHADPGDPVPAADPPSSSFDAEIALAAERVRVAVGLVELNEGLEERARRAEAKQRARRARQLAHTPQVARMRYVTEIEHFDAIASFQEDTDA